MTNVWEQESSTCQPSDPGQVMVSWLKPQMFLSINWGYWSGWFPNRLNAGPLRKESGLFIFISLLFNIAVAIVQSLSCVWLFVTPRTAARETSLSFTVSRNLNKLVSIERMMSSNHLILCCPLLLLPSIFPSIQGLFRWVSSLPQVAKVLELQLQHSSFQRIVRFDFL